MKGFGDIVDIKFYLIDTLRKFKEDFINKNIIATLKERKIRIGYLLTTKESKFLKRTRFEGDSYFNFS